MKAGNLNRSSQKTRALIKKEFAQMLGEKKQLDRIYVSDLCKRADISRGAFYSHYDDIYSVAEDFENERIEAALLARAHVIEGVTVTHYDCCVQCCGKDDGITASGVRAAPGVTVAVDPSVIPLGSDVLVDYGDGEIHYYRADDTGGAVKGNHLDLCVATHEEALQLGRRTATVYWVAAE